MNIELKSKEHVDLMLAALKMKRKELEEKISEIQNELNNVDLLIGKFAPMQAPLKFADFDAKPGYDVNWSWRRKAEFILAESIEPMTTAQIADRIIKKYEPGLTRSMAVRALSVALTTMKNVFSKEKNKNDENIFGLIS